MRAARVLLSVFFVCFAMSPGLVNAASASGAASLFFPNFGDSSAETLTEDELIEIVKAIAQEDAGERSVNSAKRFLLIIHELGRETPLRLSNSMSGVFSERLFRSIHAAILGATGEARLILVDAVTSWEFLRFAAIHRPSEAGSKSEIEFFRALDGIALAAHDRLVIELSAYLLELDRLSEAPDGISMMDGRVAQTAAIYLSRISKVPDSLLPFMTRLGVNPAHWDSARRSFAAIMMQIACSAGLGRVVN